jgi:hypothetical protein
MTFPRSIFTIAAVTTASLTTLGCAATGDQQDKYQAAQLPAVQIAQATPTAPRMAMGMGAGAAMPGYADQMKAMRDMHDKVMAAKTPEERNALMTDQMKLMQNGMSMMGGMGAGAMMGKPGHMATRQVMMEQRLDMMQSMMQMTMDRMQSVPATK